MKYIGPLLFFAMAGVWMVSSMKEHSHPQKEVDLLVELAFFCLTFLSLIYVEVKK